MPTTTEAKPLTYTENGHTYNIVCAFCVEDSIRFGRGRHQGATILIDTPKGRYPACASHAEAAR
jgi:hypothetical protein